MPFNGAGVYSPPGLPAFPAISGTTINSTYYNQVISDIASALSLTFLRDGSVPFTGDFDLAGHKLKNLGDGAVGAPAMFFQSEVNTGWYRSATNKVALAINGVKVLEFGLTGGSIVDQGGSNLQSIGWNNIPANPQTVSYVLALSDVNGVVTTTAGITVPANATVALPLWKPIQIYNNSGASITVTQAASVTLRLAGTNTTGNRTLAQRSFATLMQVAANEFILGGMGVS
jgi:hypothetical protein